MTSFSVPDGRKGAISRGIGVYPGNPDESFAPRMVRDGARRNLALNRIVSTSSDFDYNLTGQLLTDGIICNGEVNVLEGEDTWLDYRWSGYLLRADSVAVACEAVYRESDSDGSWRFSLESAGEDGRTDILGSISGDELPGRGLRGPMHTDPNKQTAAERMPGRRIRLGFRLDNPGGVDNARIRLRMKGAVTWRVTEVYFYRNGRRLFDMLPSYRFSSVWRSAGIDDEWVMADLGTVADIDRIVLRWIERPRIRKIAPSAALTPKAP